MLNRSRRYPAMYMLLTVLFLAVFTLGGVSPSHNTALANDPASSITPTLVVSGSGTVSVLPDRAKATLAIVTNDKLLTTAQEENTALTKKVTEALLAAGIPKNSIETANFSVWPRYSYPGEKDGDKPPTIVGYQVRNELRITVNQISQLGKALDAALKAGANEVNNIYYEKADTSQATNQALKKACQAAILKAQAIAGALGMQVGAIVQVQEGNTYNNNPRQPIVYKEMAGGAGDIPIQPGELQIRTDVTITMSLK